VRVAVLGAGAIGAFYGARMADGGADVTLVARGTHLAGLRDRGLTIVEPERTTEHRLPATGDVTEIGPVDVVLFCVKSYDTDAAAATLAPLVQPGTVVVSLQNGIENVERIAAAVGWDHVVGGSSYILAGVREPGVVTAGGPRRIVIGEWRGGPPSARVRAMADVFGRGGVEAEAAADVQAAKWEKLTLLVAFSAMTATVRLGLGEIAGAPAARAMLRAIMTEVRDVGRAAGTGLPDDVVDRQFDLLVAQDAGAVASLSRDLVIGHRMELDALQGAVVRIGERHGVPTPRTAAAYAILEPWARRNALPPAERAAIPFAEPARSGAEGPP
jgi:2-dehydropantoate 2-reductase